MKTKIFLSLLVISGLVGCSGTKTPHGSLDQASLNVPEDEVVVGNKAYAYCNHSTSNSSSFQIALHSYVDAGKIRNDLMYAMMTQLPSDFSSSTKIFRFFRWRVDASGQAVVDNTPLNFKLVNPSTGEDLLTSRNYLRWNEVSSFATGMNTPDPKDFFRRAFLILELKDVMAEYQGVMAVYYNTDNTEADRSNSLLPLFDVDPNGYAMTPQGSPRATLLQSLHPYKASKGTTLSLTENKVRVQALCAPWSEGI